MGGGLNLAALERHLAGMLSPGGACSIRAAERMTLGHSRAMYRLDLELMPAAGAVEQRSVVLRVEQGGVLGTDSGDEVRVMRGLAAAGYPVATVLDYEPGGDVLGFPFFVMEYVPGSSMPAATSLDAFTGALHWLHTLDWRAAGLDFLETPIGPRDAAVMQVRRWYGVYRRAMRQTIPLLEEGAAWLERYAPTTPRVGVIHGDPGPGNYIHDRDGANVVAVTDWEFAHLGDPLEDWGYLICMRGARMLNEEAWVERVCSLTGVTLDREELRYWKAFNYFKGACADVTAMRVYAEGVNTAPNMLAIGAGVHLVALSQMSDVIGASLHGLKERR